MDYELTREEKEFIESQISGSIDCLTLTVLETSWEYLIGKFDNYRVVIFDAGQRMKYGHRKLGYVFSHTGKVIFSGYDLGLPGMALPGMAYGIPVQQLLSPVEQVCFFLGRDVGELDEEIKETYTDNQLEWALENGENLGYFSQLLEEYIEGAEYKDLESDCLVISKIAHFEYGEKIGCYSGLTLAELGDKFNV